MKESYIDDKLKNIARNSNTDIPESFNERFEDTLSNLENKKSKNISFKRKYLIASVVFIVILTGVLSTPNPVSAYIESVVFSMLKEDKGLKKAEERGFMQNLSERDEDKGIEVKVEKMFLDKENIGIFLELTLDKRYRKDFDKISFGKALFKDNNDNVFYYGNNDALYDKEYHKGNVVSKGMKDNINLDDLKDNGKIKLEYRFGVNLKEIPKEINLDIRNIQLSNKVGAIRRDQKNNSGGKKRININGHWNVTLKVNEEKTKFEEYMFRGESDLIKDIKLSVAPFSSKVSFRVNKETNNEERRYYEPYKLIDNKGNEYSNIYGSREEGSNIEAKMESSYFEDIEYFDLKVRVGYDKKTHEYIYETIRLNKQ